MKMSEMYPSKFLSKEDVAHPVVATIRSVTQEEIKGDGGNELKNVVQFVGNVKSMILNKGNAAALCELYGDDSIAWHGKPIEIYVDHNVMFAGKRVGGVRLRAPSAHTPHTNGSVLTFEQAKTACHDVGISYDQLVAALRAAGAPGYNAVRDTPLVRRLIAEAQQPEQSFDPGAVYGDEIAY